MIFKKPKDVRYVDMCIYIDEKLKEAGAKTGDTVILDDFEFEYFE